MTNEFVKFHQFKYHENSQTGCCAVVPRSVEIHVHENSQKCLSSVADSHSNGDRHTNFKTIILILYRI